MKLNPLKGLKSLTRHLRGINAKAPTGAPIKAAKVDAKISLTHGTKLFDGTLNKSTGHWERHPQEPIQTQHTTGKKLTRTNTRGNLGRPMIAQAIKAPPLATEKKGQSAEYSEMDWSDSESTTSSWLGSSTEMPHADAPLGADDLHQFAAQLLKEPASPKQERSASESNQRASKSAVPSPRELDAIDKDISGLQSLSAALKSGTYGLHIIHAALKAHSHRIPPEEQGRFDALFRDNKSEAYRAALDKKCEQLKQLRNGGSAAQMTEGPGTSTVEAPLIIEIGKGAAINILGKALDDMLKKSPSGEELKAIHQQLQPCKQHIDGSAWTQLTDSAEQGAIGSYGGYLGAIVEELER